MMPSRDATRMAPMVLVIIATLLHGLYLLFRIILLVAFIFPNAYMLLITLPFPFVVSLLFAYFRPYKNNIFNVFDGLTFALLDLTLYLEMCSLRVKPFLVQPLLGILLIPFLYLMSYILFNILSRVPLFNTCCSRVGEIILVIILE